MGNCDHVESVRNSVFWCLQLLAVGARDAHDFFYSHLYVGLFHEAQVSSLIFCAHLSCDRHQFKLGVILLTWFLWAERSLVRSPWWLCVHIHWHVQPQRDRKACQQYLHGPSLILVAIVYAALVAVCLSSKLARSFGYLIDFRWYLFNQVLPLFQGLNWDVAWWCYWRKFYCAE